jgi:acetyl-CoA decarbonylase/synthase complex subunit delta
MPFKKNPQTYASSITEVVIGTGDNALALGGENVLPLYTFDAEVKNPPRIGIQISDLGPDRTLPLLAEFYAGADDVVAAAKRASEAQGADFVSLYLESSDPNKQDTPIEESVALAKSVADAVSLPLVIEGSGNVEKDAKLFEKVADALQGQNVLLLSAKEENHKGIAVAAVTAYDQKIGAESSVDINLAKQLNVLISQLGITNDNVVMNLGSSAAGYGFEYVASTVDRVKAAAMAQNDAALQMPIITPVANEAWSVKEALVSEEDFPEWGSREERGIDMEISTAAAILASGTNAVILKHPASIEVISGLVKELTA